MYNHWTVFKQEFEWGTPREPRAEDLEPGSVIALITLEEFEELPNGTELFSIFGHQVIKGKDNIDDDALGCYLAFGTLVNKSD